MSGTARRLCAVTLATAFAMALLITSHASAAGLLSAAPGKAPKTGTGPSAVVTADFNRDGRDDIAYTNSGDDTVGVLLGQREPGQFKKEPQSPASITGQDPEGLAVGNFDGNDSPDLVIANHDSSDVTVLLGGGDGKFNQLVASPYTENIPGDFTYGAGSAVAVGDFNADNKQDIVVASLGPGGDGEAETFLGDGTGGFAAATVVTKPFNGVGSGGSVEVTDFDGDGNDDLAMVDGYSGSSDNRIDVLLGGGANDFTYQYAGAAGEGTDSVAIGRLDANSTPDMAVTSRDDDSVQTFLGTGTGGFSRPLQSPFSGGDGPTSVTTGDFDGDGTTDLAVTDPNTDKVTLLLGNGDGTFRTQPGIAAGDDPTDLTTGDFDGDSRDDLAVLDFNTNSVKVLISSEQRKLSLKFKNGEFSGKLSSKSKSCEKSQKVTVYEKKGGKDPKVGTDKTSSAGSFSVKDKGKKGSYYATADASKSSGLGCLDADSKTLKLK